MSEQCLGISQVLSGVLLDYAEKYLDVTAESLVDNYTADCEVYVHIWIREEADIIAIYYDCEALDYVISFHNRKGDDDDNLDLKLNVGNDHESITLELLEEAFAIASQDNRVVV